MRTLITAIAFAALGASSTAAQTATVIGQVALREGGQPLGYTTISVLSHGMQLLTSETGRFTLVNMPPGEVRIRFKRIGFAPRDTTFTLAPNDTARLQVAMSRLVIQLPEMTVSGKCTDRTPFEPKNAELASLFDQVNQNAERVRLLAHAKPFVMNVFRVRGYRNRDNRIVPTEVDTIMRFPVPAARYTPKQVIRRGEGSEAGEWFMALPELPDFADTAFTNNHCFRYAGQTRYERDSVIVVEFEPVPWLDKEVDIKGTMYLKVDGYQLVGTITTLNRIPPQFRNSGMQELSVKARFSEIVTGVPVLDEWDLTTRFRRPTLPRVEVGQVFGMRWIDSTMTVKADTTKRPPR